MILKTCPALLPERGYLVSLQAFIDLPRFLNIKTYYDRYGNYRYTRIFDASSSVRIYPNGKEEQET
jgi:hypothetical protein